MRAIANEFNEQCTFVQWLNFRGYKFTAIPNSTFTRFPAVRRKNMELGVRPGLPDLLIVAAGSLVFIEMKREWGGQLSPYQKEWIEELNKINNIYAFVCRGAQDAINTIKEFTNCRDKHRRFKAVGIQPEENVGVTGGGIKKIDRKIRHSRPDYRK